ncbi:MAG TPA: hypothetical protein VLF67_00750 [Candidatus Saccharimonas sp.]|nr:hypothetical protein [Candidatus Saccharimonas sp.]
MPRLPRRLRVTTPAPMTSFGSLESFQTHARNFYRMFLVMEPLVGDIYRQKPAFQRFAHLYPRRVAQLESLLQAHGRLPSPESWPLLWQAYELMRPLVDLSDPQVVRQSDQAVDGLYLCR